MEKNNAADRLAGKTAAAVGLRLGRWEEFRGLRRHPGTPSKGHDAVADVKEKGGGSRVVPGLVTVSSYIHRAMETVHELTLPKTKSQSRIVESIMVFLSTILLLLWTKTNIPDIYHSMNVQTWCTMYSHWWPLVAGDLFLHGVQCTDILYRVQHGVQCTAYGLQCTGMVCSLQVQYAVCRCGVQ